MTATDQIIVFDADARRGESVVALLKRTELEVGALAVQTFSDMKGIGYGPAPVVQAIQGGQATLVVVVESDEPTTLADLARQNGVASLLIVDRAENPDQLSRRVKGYDCWVALDSLESELPIRVAALLARRQASSVELPSIDARFLALVIHDLRTPLNVIGLTIRAISQTVPHRTAELDEDLTFLTDNARQIEKMLAQLGDFCRLIEGGVQTSLAEFEPRRFLSDFLEDRRSQTRVEPTPVRFEVSATSPPEVALDPIRARLALQYALNNAINAAGDAPVLVRSSGSEGRWIIEIIVEKPPPQTVLSMELRSDRFERLTGSAAERRGLDLAIAARVSAMFGGMARLRVETGQRSTIILEWPQRLDRS